MTYKASKRMKKVRAAIVGYGNIGHYVLQAICAAPDFEVAGVVRRAGAKDRPAELSEYPVVKHISELQDVDVAILCTPTRKVEEYAKEILAMGIHTVDSFDIHTDVPALRKTLGETAKAHGTVSVISAGWDPGSDSVVRTLLEAIAPKGITYTNFGPGMSMGHTVAVKAVPGVKAALSMTIPVGTGIHRRMVYIEVEDGYDFNQVAAAIKADPYFVNDETHVQQVPSVDALLDMGHGVNLTRKGVSGTTQNQLFEFNMRINNPALTAQVLVCVARAAMRQQPGCYTMIEIPVIDLLPGEREIREAAETLTRSQPPTTEILPLYARLSAAEQEKVFKTSEKRRIVLSTNVAETSITVPGIHYVVDTGLARVKRYSYRNKVDQLLVEPVSQASANQRSGRCGRVANGICIRLYSEEDFARRPAFTDSEIMRTNLAAAILRMKALRLGDVRAFPFVQAPPNRAIVDGISLLKELNALDERERLTDIGRALAKLPVDPKVARMLLAAKENGSLAEVLIIASALSVQDPRERPLDRQEAADNVHRSMADDKSDFSTFVKLWRYVQNAMDHKESNRKLTEEFRRKFLSPRRLREWRDVYRQLKELTAELGWQLNDKEATYEQVHTALLSGLLGNLGYKIPDAEPKAAPFLGARGIKFYIWPGSPRVKKCGRWIMAAELVETSRLFARTVADVDPQWIEKVGAHLIKKSYSEPHWEKKAGAVMAMEKGTVYGLTVYGQRKVTYTDKDPALCRELFIREALVNGEFETQAPFFKHNQQLVREIRNLEHKARRLDVLVDDELIVQFYDSHIPAEVVSAVTFEQWRRKAEKDNPRLLYLSRDELMRHEASGITTEYFPKAMDMKGVSMALTYHFEPGSPRDGVTLAVPLYALNLVDEVKTQWLVPGMLKEKVQLLLKSLPQRYRRHCVPLAEYAKGFAQRAADVLGTKPLLQVLCDDIESQCAIRPRQEDFKLEQLPAHLTMNFKVLDEYGRQIEMGRNLAVLKSELGGQAQKSFQQVAAQDSEVSHECDQEITQWDFGELPDIMEIKRKGQSLIGHPALVDHDSYCSLEVFDNPDEAARQHQKGLLRLFKLQLREQIRYLEKSLKPLQSVQMQAAMLEPMADVFDSFEAMREAVIDASLNQCAMTEPLPVNAEQFESRRQEAKGKLNLIAQDISRLLSQIISDTALVIKKLKSCPDKWVRGYRAPIKESVF